MLSKKQRLVRNDFRDVSRSGRPLHTPHLSMRLISASNSETPSRFAFVVSGKVARTAVSRNRLRRRGYAAIESLKVSVHPGHTVVLYYKKGASTLSFAEISKEVRQLLRNGGLM
jgi:ribonuclease P protein component